MNRTPITHTHTQQNRWRMINNDEDHEQTIYYFRCVKTFDFDSRLELITSKISKSYWAFHYKSRSEWVVTYYLLHSGTPIHRTECREWPTELMIHQNYHYYLLNVNLGMLSHQTAKFWWNDCQCLHSVDIRYHVPGLISSLIEWAL